MLKGTTGPHASETAFRARVLGFHARVIVFHAYEATAPVRSTVSQDGAQLKTHFSKKHKEKSDREKKGEREIWSLIFASSCCEEILEFI